MPQQPSRFDQGGCGPSAASCLLIHLDGDLGAERETMAQDDHGCCVSVLKDPDVLPVGVCPDDPRVRLAFNLHEF